MANETFLIAGGGIAGLAAALGLARNGRRVTVLEQAPVLAEVGAGLQLGPNAVRALKYLGSWESIEPSTFTPQRIVIRDGHTGVLLKDIPLQGEFTARFGEPYRVIHRADLLAGLLTAVQASSGIALHPGKRLTGFTETPHAVVAETASGEVFSGDALIAADGVRSRVRHVLHGDGPPDFVGQVLFRALVPISALPPDCDPGAVALWLCRGAHAVHYSVSGGSRLNIVAIATGSWKDEDWSTATEPSEVMGCFPGCHPSLGSVLATPGSWMKWAGVGRKPARHWSKGRVTLIGDAAHPMLPFLAQGAAMALEDAAVLSIALSGERDIPTALAAYENQRLSRANRVVRASHRQALAYHASGPVRLARNAALKLLSRDAFLSRLAWLYGWQPPER